MPGRATPRPNRRPRLLRPPPGDVGIGAVGDRDHAERRSAAGGAPRGRGAGGRAPMQTVILAGGLGTRLAEETSVRPKPMVEIGDRPILHHIMDLYDAHGFTEFVLALGYLGHMIKRHVMDWTTLSGHLAVDLASGSVTRHSPSSRAWKVSLIETGDRTETGGRLKRCAPHLRNQTFMLTYGDGLSSVDLGAVLAFHRRHGKLATVTAVHPPARWGEMELDHDRVIS